MKQFKIALVFLCLTFGAKAQLNTYDYFRELQAVKEDGFYQLKVGASVLDRDGFFRIYQLNEKDTVEIQHVSSANWDIYDRSYFKDLKVIDKAYESGKHSYATVVVDTNLIYTSLYLHFGSTEFYKEITLEGSNDNKSWKTIVENEKLFRDYRDPAEHHYRNKITFQSVSFKYLRVKMDDVNSTKLDLLSASIPLEKEEVVEENEYVESFQTRTEDKQNKQTIVECLFPRNFSITELQVNVENEDRYRREVQIQLYAPTNNKDKWVNYGNGILTTGSSNKLYLMRYYSGDSDFKSNKMRIVINNMDDQPLGKISIKAFTHLENIKIKLKKDKKYVLGYGKSKDTQPYYDMSYFTNAIPFNLSTVQLGSEVKIPHIVAPVQQPLFNNKMWIWVALIACVLVIGFFVTKLMKEGMVR